MNTETIKERFNLVAEKYDEQRKKFIPCFDDYYLTTIDFISKTIKAPCSILDLGAGTGLLSKFFHEKFPNSEFTLIDISEQMLEIAKKRFSGLPNFKFEVSDYSKSLPDAHFDLITSALSIHHLDDNDKQVLYKNIFNKLSEDGYLINFDQFNPTSEALNTFYNSWWYEQIQKSDLPKSELETWLQRRELDRENTIEETILMLKKAGFQTVECIYCYMKFAVIFAIKST